MNPELRSKYKELSKKHDGSTGRDLLLAMVAAKLDVVEMLLLKQMGHIKTAEALDEHDKVFADLCDNYLSLIEMKDPMSPA